MFCPNCGKENSDENKFCANCGCILKNDGESEKKEVISGILEKQNNEDTDKIILESGKNLGVGLIGCGTFVMGLGILIGILTFLLLLFSLFFSSC